jgi:hypothetical protein
VVDGGNAKMVRSFTFYYSVALARSTNFEAFHPTAPNMQIYRATDTHSLPTTTLLWSPTFMSRMPSASFACCDMRFPSGCESG